MPGRLEDRRGIGAAIDQPEKARHLVRRHILAFGFVATDLVRYHAGKPQPSPKVEGLVREAQFVRIVRHIQIPEGRQERQGDGRGNLAREPPLLWG